MSFFSNNSVNRLGLHAAINTLAAALSYVFSAAYLMQVGLKPAEIFLVSAAILALRFVLRWLVLVVVPVMGLRRALIAGTIFNALVCPFLAAVDGVGLELAVFVAISALAHALYWTCYHVLFAALGDVEYRGSQVSACQALGAAASVFGPAVGGFLLTTLGPAPTFGAAFVIALISILPLVSISDPKVERSPPRGAYAAARTGARLYFVDGWIQVSLATGWSLVIFQALGERFDSFGGTLSLAALAGALGGMVLGRVIDLGHARRVVWANAAILVSVLAIRAGVGDNTAGVVVVAVGTAMFGGFYFPVWMSAVYNESKTAPCSFRYQFVAEGGWDAGGVLAALAAAALCFLGLPLAAVILLALPMVVVQALVLERSYARIPNAPAATSAVKARVPPATQNPVNRCSSDNCSSGKPVERPSIGM